MDFNKLQLKLIRRLTAPVEWIYVIHSHWILILCVMTLTAILVFAEVTSKDPLYEAHKTLILSTSDPVLDSDRRRGISSRDFISDQVELMNSETVLRNVVSDRGFDEILDQEKAPVGEEQLGMVQKAYRQFRESVKTIFGRLRIPAEGSPREQQEEEAVKSFRDRIQVLVPKRSNRVILYVYGTDRETLKQDLEVWIRCYKLHREDLARYRDAFLEKAKEEMSNKITKAQGDLDKFKSEHTDIDAIKYQRSIVEARFIRRNMQLESLRSGTQSVPGKLPLVGIPADRNDPPGLLQELFKLEKETEMELFRLKLKNPRNSYIVREKQQSLDVLRNEIEALKKSLTAVFSEAEEAPDDPQAKVELNGEGARKKEIKSLEKQVESDIEQLVYMDQLLERRKQLEGNIEKFRGDLEKLEQMSDLSYQLNEKQKSIRIVEEGPPFVSIDPVNQGFDKLVKNVGMAAFGGLGLGLSLAFLLEIFNRRIRFKKDVVEDLGLEVIGVLPEK